MFWLIWSRFFFESLIFIINVPKRVPIFLDIVTVIRPFSCRMANTLLRIIVKSHMHKNGMDDKPAFWCTSKLTCNMSNHMHYSMNFRTVLTELMSNFRIWFIKVGSSMSNMYQPKLLQKWAIRIAMNGLERNTCSHGICNKNCGWIKNKKIEEYFNVTRLHNSQCTTLGIFFLCPPKDMTM